MSKPKQDEIDRVDATLELVGISHLADMSVNALGLGHCRLVELARALAAEPKILLADEPSSGLDLHETAEVAAVLRTVQRERGTAVLLVEHDLTMVSEVVDRAVVMDLGSMLFAGPSTTAWPIRRYGTRTSDRWGTREHGDRAGCRTAGRRHRRAIGPQCQRRLWPVPRPVRRVVPGAGRWHRRSRRVQRRRQVHGGPHRDGTGHGVAGQVIFCGEDVTALPAYKIARLGMAHVVEGRGVFSTLTVEENLTLAFRQREGRIKLKENLERAYTAFPILGERRRQSGGTLSGGQQRLLSLAKVLVVPSKVLVADELSLGLAPVVVDAVYEGLLEINRNGTALVVVEQQVNRVLDLANWAVVLNHGSVAYQGDPAGASAAVETLMARREEAVASGAAEAEAEASAP